VHVIRGGIDAREIPAPPASRSELAGGRSLHLLSIGVLAPWRRVEDAIEGLAIARGQGYPCSLRIIGSDRFAPAYGRFLRELVRERALDDVVDLRFESVSDTELEEAYSRADVAVFPNEQQAFGLAQLEAMVRGIPVIISRGAGVSELVTDGVDGLLVDPRHPQQIARAIVQLVGSALLRTRLGQAGRCLVLESYTSLHHARRMQTLLRSCLRQPCPL
jgi:glycosyltransferase involved in cell wall biosynthesis